jgi:hypothetical protein
MSGFSLPEVALIGLAGWWYWNKDTKKAEGERSENVELENRVIEKRLGAQVPPPVILQKELELVQRGVRLPKKPLDDVSRYDAELDLALKGSESEAPAFQPLNPTRRMELGNPRWQTAGKVLMDMLYWQYPREQLRPPDYYPAEFP